MKSLCEWRLISKLNVFFSAERVNSGVILREQLNRVKSCWGCKGQINDNNVIWKVEFSR